MDRKLSSPASLRGEVTPPGDKSISHRAVIFNAIAEGKALVSNLSPGADCQATIDCMRALGVNIEAAPSAAQPAFEVRGAGLHGLKEPADVLNAGNSGTTTRLVTGLLAGQPFLSILTGDASLRSRPMERLVKPLRLMGAQLWGRANDSRAPLAIKGCKLKGIIYSLPVASAQLKTALLLAALYGESDTILEEPSPSRDHTERLLKAMGARLTIEGKRITLSPGPGPLRCIDLSIPGDLSSAAFWLVAAAIHPHAEVRVKNCNLNPGRTGIIEALQAMGADIKIDNERQQGGEPLADLTVTSSHLAGTVLHGEIIPRMIDEIPTIALAASVAKGTTVIHDASELRVKESDRIKNTVSELSKMGARIEELPDGMIIHGVGRLHGARVESHRDHRLAMTLGIAGLVAQGETIVSGAEWIDISYPTFWQDMDRLSTSQ